MKYFAESQCAWNSAMFSHEFINRQNKRCSSSKNIQMVIKKKLQKFAYNFM